MFDHCKCLSGWITMACHVYDPNYVRVVTIVVCDMQSKDVESQGFMWRALLKVMKAKGVQMPKFKGFMANNAKVNWNVIHIVFGPSRDLSQPLHNKKNLSFPLASIHGDSHQ
jgi:hypothetical protein